MAANKLIQRFRAGVILLGIGILIITWGFWLHTSIYYWDVVDDEDVWIPVHWELAMRIMIAGSIAFAAGTLLLALSRGPAEADVEGDIESQMLPEDRMNSSSLLLDEKS